MVNGDLSQAQAVNKVTHGPIGYGIFPNDFNFDLLRLGDFYHLKHSGGVYQLVEHVGNSNVVFMRHIYTGVVELIPYTQLVFCNTPCENLYYLGVHQEWFEAQMRYEAIHPILYLNRRISCRADQLRRMNADFENVEITEQQLEHWLKKYQKNYDIYDLLDDKFTDAEKREIFFTSYYWKFISAAWGKFELHRKGSIQDIVENYGEDAEFSNLNEDSYLRMTLMYFAHLTKQPSHENKLVSLLVDTHTHYLNRQLNFTIAYFTKHYAVVGETKLISYPVVSLLALQFANELTDKYLYQMIAEAMNFPYSTQSSVKKSLEYARELIIEYQVKVIAANFDGLISCEPNQVKAFVKAVEDFMFDTGVFFLIHGRKNTLDFFRQYGSKEIFLPYVLKNY